MTAPTGAETPTRISEDADTEAALEALAALLAQGREESFCALVLTDEELAVLTAKDGEQVAPFPWYDELPATQTELAQTVALRGLIARDLVAPTRMDPVTGETDLAVDTLVLAVLGARRASSDIVLAQRRSDTVSWFKAVYVQGEFGLIEENVSPGGIHHFWISGHDALADSLRVFCDPLGTATEHEPDAPVREVDLAAVAEGAESLDTEGEARLVTIVTRVDSEDGGVADEITALTYLDHVEVAFTEPDSDRVRIEPVGREGLLRSCARIVDGLTRA